MIQSFVVRFLTRFANKIGKNAILKRKYDANMLINANFRRETDSEHPPRQK